jgi:hypothetical protein
MGLRLFFGISILIFSSLLLAFDEEKVAKSLDLDPVLEAHPYNFFGVTSMYANDLLTRQMLVIQDVDAELKEIRIVEAKGFFVVEFPKDDKSYASFAFVGIKQDEVKPLLDLKPSVTQFLQDLFLIPKTFAEECSVKAPSSFESIEALNKYYERAYTQDTLKCLSQKLPPSKENLDQLKKEPRAFWERKLNEQQNLLRFISRAKKSEKLCSFFTTLTRAEIEIILSGGKGTKKIHKKFDEYLQNK